MTLLQLKYFVSICQIGSTTGAADELHVSQSTVSLSIRKLEAEIGLPLFFRGSRGLTPTAAGEYLLERAAVVLQEMARIESGLADLARGERIIHLAMEPLTENTFWVNLQTGFSRIQPPLKVHTVVIPGSYNLLKRLLSKQISCALCIIPRDVKPPAEFRSLWLGLCPELLFCVNSRHPLADRTNVSCAEIANFPLISLYNDFGREPDGRFLVKAFDRIGKKPVFTEYCSQISTALKLLRNSELGAFLSSGIVENEPGIVGIPIEDIADADYYLLWDKDIKVTGAFKDFLRYMKAHAEKRSLP